MKTILVTGKDSQLANCIRDAERGGLNAQFIYKDSKELDITDNTLIRKVFKEHKIDYCINCAAYTAVDKAESEEKKAMLINTVGAKNLALACKEFNTTLIHISTDFVFDGISKSPYKEEGITNSLGVYGTTKRDGEQEIIKHCEKHFIIRTSWLYSEYGHNFMKTMLRLSETKSSLSVVSDQIGSPTYAGDLAGAIIKIVNSNSVNYGLYNFSNKGNISWYDFAKAIFKFSNKKVEVNAIKTIDYPTDAIRPQYSVLSTTKFSEGFAATIQPWDTSLKKVISNYKTKENINIAIKAALEAGKAIMEVYESDISIEYKDDKSPLTEADKRANAIINSHLNRTEIPIISEENKQIDFNVRKQWDKCWIVDPVDGTKEFIKRNGEFTVNIALVEKRVPKIGVIYVPESKVLYVGDVEKKYAFKMLLESHDSDYKTVISKTLSLSQKRDTKNIRVVSSRSHINDKTLNYIEELKSNGNTIETVSRGSSLKFCLIAEDLADVYPRFAPTMEWDTAAGDAICSAVNIKVISEETNKPLLYNKENLLNPSFIVSKQ